AHHPGPRGVRRAAGQQRHRHLAAGDLVEPGPPHVRRRRAPGGQPRAEDGVRLHRPARPLQGPVLVTAANPTTFVIGAGPVATALAGALRLGGVPVLGLWARRSAQARAAGASAGVAAFSSAPPDLLLETQVVILAVRDRMIGEVAAMLAGTG